MLVRLTWSCLLCTLLASTATADWTHWRGPAQNGTAPDTNLPGEWSPKGKNLLWKQPYSCRSTPIVSRGKVYIIGSVGEKETEGERVACFDASTGEKKWEYRFNVFLADIVTSRVGWANLTADPETGNVYAHGVQGLFFCFSEDGKVLWQKSLTEEYGRVSGYGGRISSPVVFGDLVIIHNINASWGDQGRGAHRFLAMDKKTGAVRWWSEAGPSAGTNYSVPIEAHVNGQHLLICGGSDGKLHAMQLATGKKVWSYPVSLRALNVSPVLDGTKVYIAHSEENLDTNQQAAVVCVDAAKVENGQPKLVWRRIGIPVGYASLIIHNKRLYACDNSAKMHCLNADTGETIWEFRYGRNAKGSPVWADGKIYVAEVNAKYHILQPGDTNCKRLNTVQFLRPDGLVIEVNGSPAVSDGKVYLCTADELYCIGFPAKKSSSEMEAVVFAGGGGDEPPPSAAQALLDPADTVIHPGETASFKVRLYDADGHELKPSSVQVTWGLPAIPPPPNAPPNSPTLPALKGTISPEGQFTAEKGPSQAGVVEAKIKVDGKELVARARVRVAPVLPLHLDFEKIPEGRIPGGWINAAGKFQVVKLPEGGQGLKKLANNPFPTVARSNAYIGMPDLKDYTITCDILGHSKVEDVNGRQILHLPDMGVINCRYELALDGGKQELWLRTWAANLRINKTIPYKWEAGKWYRFKLEVVQQGDKAVARGKVWLRDQPEPPDWTLVAEDPSPNREGSPGLYTYGRGIPTDGKGVGTEIFFDNLHIVPNGK
jgi:outer membrane protein assembly factor BamB